MEEVEQMREVKEMEYSETSLQDIAPSNLLVRVGEYHVLKTNEPHKHIDRRIKKVVTHRNFDKATYEYDIALLEMHNGPINYQPNMIPICLPTSDNNLVGEVRIFCRIPSILGL